MVVKALGRLATVLLGATLLAGQLPNSAESTDGLNEHVYLPLVVTVDTVSPIVVAEAYSYLHAMLNLYHTDETLRLADSYSDNANDTGDMAWVYDNSLVILALLARGEAHDRQQAYLIADALVFAQAHDPVYSDGRLRDGYHALALVDADDDANVASGGSSTGNMAWALLGLLGAYRDSGNAAYLAAAESLAAWIVANTHDTRGSGGFTGGVDGNNVARQWKSTEHNIDLVAAFGQLYQATQDEAWRVHSVHAATFVRSMWHAAQGHFWTGTGNDGVTPNYYPIPEDTQSWPILALDNSAEYVAALAWAQANLSIADCSSAYSGVTGVRFSTGGSGCSFEATAHMALALKIAGEEAAANALLRSLKIVLLAETDMNGGLVAAPPGGAPTGFGFAYPHAAHIGATAWFLLAELEANPFQVP